MFEFEFKLLKAFIPVYNSYYSQVWKDSPADFLKPKAEEKDFKNAKRNVQTETQPPNKKPHRSGAMTRQSPNIKFRFDFIQPRNLYIELSRMPRLR